MTGEIDFSTAKGGHAGGLSRSSKSADPEYFNGQLSGTCSRYRGISITASVSCALIKTLTRYILQMKLDTDRKRMHCIRSGVTEGSTERWGLNHEGSGIKGGSSRD